jgi:hypothetical protein
MLTVISVLRSGGIYNYEWVAKLRRGVERNLNVPHRFVCLSDVPVPCERIPLEHAWPGWWSKIELFRPGVISGPTLYLDLDNIIVGCIDALSELPFDFAMMRNFHRPHMPGSSVMWFGHAAPKIVYDSFATDPLAHMAHYAPLKDGVYMGDQGFIWDTLERKVEFIDEVQPDMVRSYRKHCKDGVPNGVGVVAFGGPNKPSTVADEWVARAWA